MQLAKCRKNDTATSQEKTTLTTINVTRKRQQRPVSTYPKKKKEKKRKEGNLHNVIRVNENDPEVFCVNKLFGALLSD